MRVFLYIFIISGIMALLYNGGFTDLPTADLISSTLSGGLQGIKDSTFYSQLTAVLALVAIAGGIAATLFGRTPDITLLTAGFITFFLGAFLIDLIWLYQKLFSYGTWYAIVASIVLIPLTYGFIESAYKWWTGGD